MARASAKSEPVKLKVAFDADRGRTTWIDPDDVEAVTAMPTRYGDKLLVTMKSSGRQEWIVDSATARRELRLTA